MMLLAPGAVTVAVAGVLESVILLRLMPTSPPRKLSDVPATGPDAVELTMGLMLPPTSPPTVLFGPVLVTDPVAVAKLTVPRPSWNPVTPTNPPRKVLPAPRTLPCATLVTREPSLAPTNPPARLSDPTVTLPKAVEPVMNAVLKNAEPSPKDAQPQRSKKELLPTNPPATL